MRSADAATLIRVAIVFIAIYLVIIRYDPLWIILLIAIAMAIDGIDGFLAIYSESGGAVGLGTYLRSALTSNPIAKAEVKKYKDRVREHNKFGPRIDVAGDRIEEYALWFIFTYLGIVPLFVLFIVIVRHSFVDAIMGSHGTSAKIRTRFAKIFYSSNISRAIADILKFITFSYLVLVYVWGYSLVIGHILIGALAAFIVIRGIAQVVEVLL